MSAFKSIADYFSPVSEFRREVACFLDGEMNIVSLSSENCCVQVSFDWEKIWSCIKPMNPRPHQVFMIHSHPPGCNGMSSTDRNMVHGWVSALGIPIWYIILVNGEYIHYLCQKIQGKLVIDCCGNSYGEFGLGQYQGEILKMVIGGVSNARDDFRDKAELDSIAMEVNSVFKHFNAYSLNMNLVSNPRITESSDRDMIEHFTRTSLLI